ncbi:MAG: hypothetical protein VX938_05905, partial [Myxococcota bacterium]|nr:hypothetical protein [Myxococcota bacterium]
FAWLFQEICDGVCVSGKCASCYPGQNRCNGDLIESCGADGESWEEQKNCSEEGDGLMCLSGQCVDPCSSDFKFNTNIGCEYWAVDLDQTFEGDSHNSPFAIVVSNVNSQASAMVSLYRDGNLEEEVEVGASDLHIFSVDPHNVDGSMKDKRAFRLRSTRPIIAYQFNPLENVGVFSNDASMLIPLNSLGSSYRVLGWPERPGDLHGYVTMVATEDQTEVTIEVTANTAAGPGGVPALSNGESWTTILNAYEVLSVETNGAGQDLSGTLISSSKPIAVFSGHECANVPDTTACDGGICAFAPLWTCSGPEDCPAVCCCDHLEEQLFPISAWGKTYVGARSTPRGLENDHWRVVAAEDNTQLTFDPPVASAPIMAAGDVFEFPAVDSFVLTADKPVMLGQFLASEFAPGVSAGICNNSNGLFGSCTNLPGEICLTNQDCVADAEPGDAGIGDPAFVLAVPVEQLRDEYVFLVPD